VLCKRFTTYKDFSGPDSPIIPCQNLGILGQLFGINTIGNNSNPPLSDFASTIFNFLFLIIVSEINTDYEEGCGNSLTKAIFATKKVSSITNILTT